MFKLICFMVILVVAFELSSADAFRRRNRNKGGSKGWGKDMTLRVTEIRKEKCNKDCCGDKCWKPRPKCSESDCGRRSSSSCKGSECGRRCRNGRCPPYVIPPIIPPVTLEPVTTTMGSGSTGAPGTGTTGAPGTVTTGAPGNGTTSPPVTLPPITTPRCPVNTRVRAVNIDVLESLRTALAAVGINLDDLLETATNVTSQIVEICASAAVEQVLDAGVNI